MGMCFNSGNNCSCLWWIIIIVLLLCCCAAMAAGTAAATAAAAGTTTAAAAADPGKGTRSVPFPPPGDRDRPSEKALGRPPDLGGDILDAPGPAVPGAADHGPAAVPHDLLAAARQFLR